VLEETFGIMVYQEDVSRAAKALAGFSDDRRPTACARSSPKKTGSASLEDYRRRFHRRQPLQRGVTAATN
jgi:DNA polymerase III alpha subunit